MPVTRAVLYSRVSTPGQAEEGVSLEAQQDMAERYCKERGWTFAGVYTDVMTGKNDKRPQLRALELDAKARRFEVVLVYRTDRLARSFNKATAMMAHLADYDVALVSMTEPLDLTTPMGKAIFGLLAGFAEQESVNTGNRVRDAKKYQAARGVWQSYKVPVGYRYVGKEAGGARVEVDEDWAPLVRRIFDMFTRHAMTYSGITHALNDEGATTREGARWYPATVRDILQNPAYTGRVIFGRQKRVGTRMKAQPRDTWVVSEEAFPAIIDADTWVAAEARAEEQSKLSPREVYARTRRPWSGLLRCKGCGSRMPIHTDGHGGYRYTCRSPRQVCEVRTHIPYHLLEELVIPALQTRLDRVEASGNVTPRPASVADKGKRIAALEKKIATAKRLALAEVLSEDEARDEIAKARAQLANIEAEGGEYRPFPILPGMLADIWANLTPAEQSELVRLFVDHIAVGWDGMIVHLVDYDAPGWGEWLQLTIPRRYGSRRSLR